MTYILTEVADRERLANQARAISLGTWAASILLIAFALVPSIRSNAIAKAVLIFASCGMTAVSRATAGNLATHDRVLQDFRDISDNQRQQLIYEALAPKQLMKSAEAPIAAELPTPLPVHNLSQAISQTLKSTVLLGAPRAGKGYAIARAVQQLPVNIDLWLIDPKDDPNESYYWSRIPIRQRTRFDVTTLEPDAVTAKVTGLFEQFLLAPSSADKPKLLIVDECSPGLSKGMTPKAYKAFMGRLSTICSVGPSKGKFVWIMAQASTVEDLAMTSGNKASFRLCAVGHAKRTEKSWYSSLKRSMQIETPAAALTGYLQMLDGEWGYAAPFEVTREGGEPEDSHRAAEEKQEPSLSQQSREVLSYFSSRSREHVSLRQLTQASFARREGLTSQRSMMAALAPLLDAEQITETTDGDYLLNETRL